jgi:hypothetical protein
MLTFFITGCIKDVMVKVKEMETDMINKKIPIIRTKIEAMAHMNDVPNECQNDHYFEFHFKVCIKNTQYWNKLVELLVPFGAHLFYNPYKRSLTPIVTIRRYTSLTDLEAVYAQITNI